MNIENCTESSVVPLIHFGCAIFLLINFARGILEPVSYIFAISHALYLAALIIIVISGGSSGANIY